MTTREMFKQAVKIAEMNGDMLVVSCLLVIEAHYITEELQDVVKVLVEIAKQKVAKYRDEQWELPE